MYGLVTDHREEFLNGQMYHSVTFRIKLEDLRELPQECELTIEKYSEGRNKDQNAKYWSIVEQIAKLVQTSKTAVHNALLADYGKLELKDGQPVNVWMEESYDHLNAKDIHLFPTGNYETINGKQYAEYYKLVDSRMLSKKDFSRLMDGAIYELREVME